MAKLKSLRLSQTPVTGTGLSQLRAEKLTSLTIVGRATDEGARSLNQFPALLELCLVGPEITDLALDSIGRQNQLTTLEIGAAISDAGLGRLKNLTTLSTLRFAGAKITDAGVRIIAEQWPHLDNLDLAGCPITDAALEHLAAMKQLVSLSLKDCRTTSAGRRALRAKLPECTVLPAN